jgi:hypothetical protein
MDKPERRSGPQSSPDHLGPGASPASWSPPGGVPGLGPVGGPSPDPETDRGFDEDFDEWTAWLDREVAAGRDPVPPERVTEAEGISVSVGHADGIDPGLLAAICGPDSDGLGSQFGQDAAADVLPPGPVLAALTEAAVADATRLSDSQLIGVLQAARRQENREAWKKALVIAEFARRRAAEFEAAAVAGAPVHCRPGQFPGEELAVELLLGPAAASHAIDDAGDLTTRLPRTLAGMAAGLIDEARAGAIAMYTRSLSADDVALADDILAALAPTLRLDRLIGKAASLEKKLNPDGVRARQEHARRTRQRVEVRREDSGNASVAGREMDPGEALASKAYLHALALRLRRAGLPGTLDQLRLAVFGDLTSGRDPMDRLARPAVTPAAADPAGPDPAGPDPAGPESATASVPKPDPATLGPTEGDAGSAGHVFANPVAGDAGATRDSEGPVGQPGFVDYDHDEDGGGDCPDDATPGPRPPVPMPAMINLVVHAGTLFGWDTTPTEVGGWGLLDADETRALVAAASQHPATRWCLTLLGLDGTAGAHGCSPGQHHWSPEEPNDKPPGRRPPDPAQVTALAAFLRGLNVTPEPIAKGDCDHAAAGSRYTPSRNLAHLVRARTVTCDAPGCSAQAVHSDLDHTTPYPQGPTCQCNLAPKCRRHHKAKQAPDWKVEQPEPDLICWTLPNGRTYTTRPTSYFL